MRAILLATTLILALAAPAIAEECVPNTTTGGVIAAGPYYVYEPCLDTEDHPEQCGWWGPWAIWIYEESNGIEGLQRSDEMVDDTCGMFPGDTVVF